MTLRDEIKKLPKWPGSPKDNDVATLWARERSLGYAALARLALIAKMAKDGDTRLVQCTAQCWLDTHSDATGCTCGRDALLAAITPEIPRTVGHAQPT